MIALLLTIDIFRNFGTSGSFHNRDSIGQRNPNDCNISNTDFDQRPDQQPLAFLLKVIIYLYKRSVLDNQ